MRLQLIGYYSLDELRDAFASIVKDLEDKHVESVRSVNIYLQPCANHKELRFFQGGREVDHMVYDFDKIRKIEIARK